MSRPKPKFVDAADRGGPPREDLPLPTQPPWTAFVGNLPFDLTEEELGGFFEGIEVSLVIWSRVSSSLYTFGRLYL